jgi:lipopolysaccharide heptosyltransferase II
VLSASRRVLVRLPNWLGDALLARPLLHGLRGALPQAEVHAVAPAALLALLEPEHTFDRGHPWPGSGRARAALAAELRTWEPELALVLPPSFSSAWFAWRAGARERVGYGSDLRSALLTRALPRPERGELHLSREYLSLGASAGVAEPALPVLLATAPATAAAAALIEPGARTALLGPGAIYGPAKRWPRERFAALGRRLAAAGMSVRVCGSERERGDCEWVAEAIGAEAASLAGRTDLATQLALCAAAALAVCNDSGLAHLAAAAGTPTVVIFGSTSSAWTAPLGPRVRVVQRAPLCSPCFQRTCRIGYRCLTMVAVDEVERACAQAVA